MVADFNLQIGPTPKVPEKQPVANKQSVPEITKGSITGNLINPDTGMMLSGVGIKVKSKDGKQFYDGKTDRVGSFNAKNLDYGLYTIIITKEGYGPIEEKMEITKESPHVEVDFNLQYGAAPAPAPNSEKPSEVVMENRPPSSSGSSGSISGMVLDNITNSMMKGVTVEIKNQNGKKVFGGETDMEGTFSARELSSGQSYQITISKTDYETLKGSVELTEDAPNVTLELKLKFATQLKNVPD